MLYQVFCYIRSLYIEFLLLSDRNGFLLKKNLKNHDIHITYLSLSFIHSPALDPKYLQKQSPPPLAAHAPTAATADPLPTPLPGSVCHPPSSSQRRGPSAHTGPHQGGVAPGRPSEGVGSGQPRPPLMSAYFPRSMQTAT